MKTIMITAPSSNMGKTTISLGLVRAIKNRGIDVSGFKTGPDYIDKKYLGIASDKYSGNLDMHMMGNKGIRDALAMNKGEVGIIEGAMGYFDGISNTYKNSSYDISRDLDIPAILIYTPRGEMFSAIPKIKGMVDFKDSKIEGIIFNKVGKNMYDMLKDQVEKYIGIKVLGYLPSEDSISIPSSKLGLEFGTEVGFKNEKIVKTAELVEKTIDIDEILKMAKNLDIEDFEYPKKRNIKVAIASDEAFNFHYTENLRLISHMCEIEYFSIIRSRELPEADLVLIGGGYPEKYKNTLSENLEMINSFRNYIENGGYLIAEAGGLMYLSNSIDGVKMCGVIDGETETTDKLERFGYVDITTEVDTILGPKGTKIKGHEYHKSKTTARDANIFKIEKPISSRAWTCGYKINNMLAFYQHINYLGNRDILENILNSVEKNRG